jgi:hypothetical protein
MTKLEELKNAVEYAFAAEVDAWDAARAATRSATRAVAWAVYDDARDEYATTRAAYEAALKEKK